MQIPTLRGQARASGSLTSDGRTHRVAVVARLLFRFRVWVRRTVCGNSLAVIPGLCEQGALQEKERCGRFFPFLTCKLRRMSPIFVFHDTEKTEVCSNVFPYSAVFGG